MSDLYKYRDKKKVMVAQGQHGMNLPISGGGPNCLQSLPNDGENDACFELRSYVPVEAEPLVCRQHPSSTGLVTLDRPATVEFISYGHSHIYPADQYPEVAPLWRDRLLAEARHLARSLQGDQAIAREFLEADGSLGAWMTHGIAHLIDTVKSRKPIRPEDYDPLMSRVWSISDKIKAGTAADYQILHDAGLELMHVRHDQDELRVKFQRRMTNLIDAAEGGQKTAEGAESASFWLLDLYGQAICKDAGSLFAYRFGVLIVRAGAHGAGSLIADNSAHATFQEITAVVRQELPGAAKDLMLSFLKKGFDKMGAIEIFAEKLIAINIDIFFITLDFTFFEVDKLPPGKSAGDALLEKLAPEIAQDIVNAIAAIIVADKVNNPGLDSSRRKKIEAIGAVVPAVISSSIREFSKMRQQAADQGKPLSDVFVEEGGWALVRVLRDGGKAFLEPVIKGKMEAEHANDVNYYRALILRIQLNLAPLNTSRINGPADRPAYVQPASPPGGEDPTESSPAGLQSSWDKKLPKVQAGPDANGDIGIHKLQPVAGPPSPRDTSKPPKPDRAARKKVKMTPPQNRVPGAEEMVAKIGPAYSWHEIEKMQDAGQIRDKAHVLAVIVRDPRNQTVQEWYEVSELNVALGTKKLLGHTEQKAMARITLMKLKPGSTVIFVGHLQPCNLEHGCNQAMKDFVSRNRDLTIEYRAAYSDDDTTHIDYDADGRTSDADRKKKVLH